jgi:hypothetical protein
MDTILKIVDPTENFWIANPAFLTIRLFKSYHDEDKSKKKDYSSRVMWAIAFLVDMHPQNVWRNKGEEEKKPVLAEDVIGDKAFDWYKVQDLIDTYLSHCVSIPKKELRNFLNKIHQRQKFIDDTPFTLDSFDENGRPLKGTATQLDKMMVDTAKVWAVHDDLLAKFEEEDEEGAARGGRSESISEQGII